MNDPLYIGIRFALYADLMLLFGLPLFALYTPEGRDSVAVQRPILIGLAIVGMALSAAAIAAMTASMAGVPILDVDRASISAMISATPMGMAWAVRMGALALLAIGLVALRRPAVIASFGAIALGSLAWTGHGAAGEGNAGTVQLIGDLLHLLSAGAWLGALVGLSALLWANSGQAETHRALDRFASAGSVIVAAVVGSGLVNGFYIVGWSKLGSLLSTFYGQLLLLKLALFAAMLGLAATNRFRLTPALGKIGRDNADGARRALRKSLMLETGAAIAILGLVAWLGTLAPPMSR
ncbi:copper homeostasis membrane protein CopD [Novosphingobium sp.]|uniref:copper homeostasis membrane protein CopD n=1 Tax=Novosphingobium sp. TaxID=1874826 RepID=UPI0025E8B534|nr:copper homeostasis membrane protein CopD [Novosphingobium sp.]